MTKYRKGWMPDLPDHRDYDEKRPVLKALLKKSTASKSSSPTKVDLRKWCSPIENQGDLGSCTAHAGVGLFEYFMRRASGRHLDLSRLFLYKATRNLLGWTGDDGAYLRSTIGAMVLFGIPPESYWPYEESQFNSEPSAFCYSFAKNFSAIEYYRLDGVGVNKPAVLTKIKTHLESGLPSIFGFTVFNSIDLVEKTGQIPFPGEKEKNDGGHAVMAVGYDDNIKITNPLDRKVSTKGALLIRNSWGTEWGENGYGWLPYEYVLRGLAVDWWCIMKADWVDTIKFE